jgi:ABC-2 type transport system permease protein
MMATLVPTLIKEIQLLRRDPRVIVRLILLPVAFITLFGAAFSGSEHKPTATPVIVWVDPQVAAGPRIVAAIDASLRFHAVAAASADQVRSQVADETYAAGLVIPRDFAPTRGGTKAELVIDTGKPRAEVDALQAPLTSLVTRAVIGGWSVDVVTVVQPPGTRKPMGGASAFQITVPGNAVLFGFFIAVTCALSFSEERRSGTWRRLLATPVPPSLLLAAKLIPYVALGTLQVGLLFAIGVFGFGMQIGGSIAALAVLSVGVALCATTLGLLIAAVSSTEKQVSSLGTVAVLIMGLLGGCMLPRMLMPHTLQQIGLFVPHGWALDGYNALLVREGAGFADVAKPILAVYGFAAAFLIAGLRRFRFD